MRPKLFFVFLLTAAGLLGFGEPVCSETASNGNSLGISFEESFQVCNENSGLEQQWCSARVVLDYRTNPALLEVARNCNPDIDDCAYLKAILANDADACRSLSGQDWQGTCAASIAQFRGDIRVCEEAEKPEQMRGLYLHPEAFGKPRELAIEYLPDKSPPNRTRVQDGRAGDSNADSDP